MLRYGIAPAQPPLPSWWYLPFHPVTGSHSANLISESGLGRIVPFTSQCAGTVGAPFAAPPGPAGPENGPAGTSVEAVMTVWESLSVARLSQVCANSGEAGTADSTSAVTEANRFTTDDLPRADWAVA